MIDKKYIYEIEEYSQDVRKYQVTSNVKLTQDEIRSIYTEAYEEEKVVDKLEGNVDWSNERFTDNQILNEIKITGSYSGTEYGDDCQVGIIGDIEGDE
jgi:hypothetical protein